MFSLFAIKDETDKLIQNFEEEKDELDKHQNGLRIRVIKDRENLTM